MFLSLRSLKRGLFEFHQYNQLFQCKINTHHIIANVKNTVLLSESYAINSHAICLKL